MRLIDADALKIEIMDRGIDGLQLDDYSEIQQVVDDAPTVSPVRHGHWTICKSYNPAFNGYECSECGAQFQGYRPDNYCGNCGAKMDGDNGNK